MADQLQLRGGTTAEHATFTGALREVTVDTDKDTVVVHDNATAGGHPLAKENLSNVSAATAATKLDGQTVKFGLGAAATPSVTFNGDLNTGVYSPGSDQVAITTGGTARLTSSTTAVTSALPIDHPLGSAAAPTVTFTGDLNTGIYSPGADQVAISTGGSGRLFVDASGRIAIGGTTVTDSNLLNIQGSTATHNVGVVLNKTNGTAQVWGIQNGGSLSFFNYTASSTALTIDTSNRVGVGSSSPQCQLTNTGNSSFGTNSWPTTDVGNSAGRVLIGNEGQLMLWNETVGAGNTAVIMLGAKTGAGANTLGYSAVRGGTENASNRASFMRLETCNSVGTPSTAVYVDSSQRVGIGTATPGRTLSVDSSIQISNSTSGFSLGNGLEILHESDGESYFINRRNGNIRFHTNNTERARLTASGQWLVGTSTSRIVEDLLGNGPQGLIQIEATNSDAIMSIISAGTADAGRAGTLSLGRHRNSTVGGTPTIVQNGDTLGAICFAGGDGTDMRTKGASIAAQVDGTPGADDMPGRLVFSTTADGASSPTERMRIKETGHSKFSNTGSYRSVNTGNHEFLNSLNTVGLEVYNTNTSLTATVLQISADRNTTNGTYKLIQASRIGSTDAFWVLDSGNVQNTNNSYTGTSDAKLKENIVDASSQWGDIKSLQVRKFNFKEETGNSTHTQIGLIAQEVEQVSPGLVSDIVDRDEDGNDLGTVTKSVNYSVLYMKAVKALQEAMERIETLEAKVAALESA